MRTTRRNAVAMALLCWARLPTTRAQFAVNVTGDMVDTNVELDGETTTSISNTIPYSVCAQNVRKRILDGYDKIVVPKRSGDDRVNVTVQLVYHTVTDISESTGLIEIFAWITLRWNDHRLAWDYDANADETGLCTDRPVNARAEKQQGLKDSEIWVPEFDLYNQVTGVTRMTGQLAKIASNGDVEWFRTGPLKAICQMENLGQIPFENLGCQLLFGSISEGVYYSLDPQGGLFVSNYAGPYNGYRLVNASPGFANGGNTVFFNFEYKRGRSYYVQNIIIPVLIFTYCSIGTLLVGVGAFQTLALNFTLLLSAVAQKIAIGNALPITNERLWLVDFVGGSFYFIVLDIIYIFVKFIVTECREERNRALRSAEADAEDGGSSPKEVKTFLPEFCFTFSMRFTDVVWTITVFVAYTIFLIVTFTANNEWGESVKVFHVVNGTNAI